MAKVYKPSWLYRMGWLIFFWLLGVFSLGMIALFFRMLMVLAGFKR